ncbi:transposase [Bacillus velezensis]|nr:transposase [Bacillus velezensis]QDF53664.1 transposase [Bacillus velezensis]
MSKEAGIAKATLYNNKGFRSKILRNQQSQVPTPQQVKREMNVSNKYPPHYIPKKKTSKAGEGVSFFLCR